MGKFRKKLEDPKFQEQLFLCFIIFVAVFDITNILILHQSIVNNDGFSCCTPTDCRKDWPNEYESDEVFTSHLQCYPTSGNVEWCEAEYEQSTFGPIAGDLYQCTNAASLNDDYTNLCSSTPMDDRYENIGMDFVAKEMRDRMERYLYWKIACIVLAVISTAIQLFFDLDQWKPRYVLLFNIVRWAFFIASIVLSLNIIFMFRKGFDVATCDDIFEDYPLSLHLCQKISESCPVSFLYVVKDPSSLQTPSILSIISAFVVVLSLAAGTFIKWRRKKMEKAGATAATGMDVFGSAIPDAML